MRQCICCSVYAHSLNKYMYNWIISRIVLLLNIVFLSISMFVFRSIDIFVSYVYFMYYDYLLCRIGYWRGWGFSPKFIRIICATIITAYALRLICDRLYHLKLLDLNAVSAPREIEHDTAWHGVVSVGQQHWGVMVNKDECIPCKPSQMVRGSPAIKHFWCIIKHNKNSSGDEIANVNFYAVRPGSYRFRWNNAK